MVAVAKTTTTMIAARETLWIWGSMVFARVTFFSYYAQISHSVFLCRAASTSGRKVIRLYSTSERQRYERPFALAPPWLFFSHNSNTTSLIVAQIIRESCMVICEINNEYIISIIQNINNTVVGCGKIGAFSSKFNLSMEQLKKFSLRDMIVGKTHDSKRKWFS